MSAWSLLRQKVGLENVRRNAQLQLRGVAEPPVEALLDVLRGPRQALLGGLLVVLAPDGQLLEVLDLDDGARLAQAVLALGVLLLEEAAAVDGHAVHEVVALGQLVLAEELEHGHDHGGLGQVGDGVLGAQARLDGADDVSALLGGEGVEVGTGRGQAMSELDAFATLFSKKRRRSDARGGQKNNSGRRGKLT